LIIVFWYYPNVELEFLEKLFHKAVVGKDFGRFEIITNKNIDLSRLYAKFLSLKKKANVILLPQNFISPKLDVIELQVKSQTKFSDLTVKLSESGYEKVEQIYNSMQYMVRGDVLSIYSNISNLVYRIEFFGDEVEKISLIDNVSMRPVQQLKNLVLLNFNPEDIDFEPEIFGNYEEIYSDLLIQSPDHNSLIFGDGEKEINDRIQIKSIPLFHKNIKVFHQYVEKYEDYDFYYLGTHWEVLPAELKKINSSTSLQKLELSLDIEKGFVAESQKVLVLTDRELLSTLNLTKSKSKLSSKFKKLFDNEVNVGDYVVHEAHGVGIYKGIETKVVLGEIRDYAIVEYLNNDSLLIPLDQLARLSKYISAEGSQPKLTKLGTAEWEAVKRKLKKSVEDIAKELLEIYAKKSMEKGIKFKLDSADQEVFEKAFAHKLTKDQQKTLNEVKEDMEAEKPMDRLIIGDVGFGKTEIALRAAFKAVQSGKQVVVVAPTTILVTQLFEVFAKRLGKFGVRVARVSRFDGSEKNKESIQKANEGNVDIIIGTHRLLSKDVKIENIGLLIIDEEQRFGVKQKEKIRRIRTNIDVLSMSATPIPRTLQMALTGIKDISIIATPPEGRKAVTNAVIFKDEIPEKIEEEVRRGGQVFVVHNRVEDLDTFVAKIKTQLSPDIKIITGHGQMSGDKLEKIMFDFQEGLYHVLIATTIIENGLDIPSVNTMIIDDAHNFGLAQLYQLRGRVGRSKVQGFCYLVLPKIKEFVNLHNNPGKAIKELHKLLEENKINDRWVTPESISRIEAILENQELGAGFKIASRDLEIRGSGNILGAEQSGNINSVGYEMFIRLLEQEIDQIRQFVKAEKEEEKSN
jgi:transcription-repair coupling factor (superfamily II helicase)